jgi:hypothetical protein
VDAGEKLVMDALFVRNPLPSANSNGILSSAITAAHSKLLLDDSLIKTTTRIRYGWTSISNSTNVQHSAAEFLAVEVWNGSQWVKVAETANNGDVDWTLQNINITNQAKGKVFKVRFTANGTSSVTFSTGMLIYIHIYVGYEFNPPINLVTEMQGNPKNDIK